MARRKVDDITYNATHQELVNSIKNIPNTRDRALAAFLYLAGCRISELLGTIKLIKIYKNGEYIDTRKINVEPLKSDAVEILPDAGLILIHNVPCLKHRRTLPRRNIPIKIRSDSDLAIIFLSYWRNLEPGQPLFKMTRRRAHQIINKHLKVFPHYLIHQRITELVGTRGLGEQHIRVYRGWKDTRPASIYSHLNYHDLAGKL